MAKRCFLSFILCLSFVLSQAQNFDKAEILSVYDGDTFKVNLPCKEDIFCKEISVRVKGIDTPEIKGKNSCEKKKAKEAQKLSNKILNSGTVVLEDCKRDKYFRLLCKVVVLQKNQGVNLADELLQANLAVRYNGETKPNIDWCKTPDNKNNQDNFIEEILDQIFALIEKLISFIKQFIK